MLRAAIIRGSRTIASHTGLSCGWLIVWRLNFFLPASHRSPKSISAQPLEALLELCRQLRRIGAFVHGNRLAYMKLQFS